MADMHSISTHAAAVWAIFGETVCTPVLSTSGPQWSSAAARPGIVGRLEEELGGPLAPRKGGRGGRPLEDSRCPAPNTPARTVFSFLQPRWKFSLLGKGIRHPESVQVL